MTDQPYNRLDNCPQCNGTLKPDFAYCPTCGQKKIPPKENLVDIFRNFLGDYFAYDSKLILSLKPLLFNPGFLSLEYKRGKRVRYISPLRLYIFISIFFFILLNWSGSHDLSSKISADAIVWNDFFHNYLPKVFFLLLPLFAAILGLLFRKAKTGYVFQLIVSLHFHTFLFLTLSAYLILSKIIATTGLYYLNLVFFSAIAVWSFIYLLVSLKRIYKLKWFATVGRFLLLVLIYGFLIGTVLLLILGYITISAE